MVKTKSKKALLSAQVRAIGEHYVFARLAALGFIVGLTPENTKSIDLLAISEEGNKSIQIQVKTRTEGRSSDKGWHMKDKHEAISGENLFYVFVVLPAKWTDENQPLTYIIPSKKVCDILRRSHQDWLCAPGAKGQKRNDTRMRRILPCYKDSSSISANWMDEYKDNWLFK